MPPILPPATVLARGGTGDTPAICRYLRGTPVPGRRQREKGGQSAAGGQPLALPPPLVTAGDDAERLRRFRSGDAEHTGSRGSNDQSGTRRACKHLRRRRAADHEGCRVPGGRRAEDRLPGGERRAGRDAGDGEAGAGRDRGPGFPPERVRAAAAHRADRDARVHRRHVDRPGPAPPSTGAWRASPARRATCSTPAPRTASPTREEQLALAMCARRVDGLVIIPTPGSHDYLVSEIEAGVATVFVLAPPELVRADAVLPDERGGARTAIAHLVARGPPERSACCSPSPAPTGRGRSAPGTPRR